MGLRGFTKVIMCLDTSHEPVRKKRKPYSYRKVAFNRLTVQLDQTHRAND